MRAIVFAHRNTHAMESLNDGLPTQMIPLVDRPFIHHVIDLLVQQGVRSIDLVLSEEPKVIEDYVGDGVRWGIDLRCHLVRDPERPYNILRVLVEKEVGAPRFPSHFLVAHADRLPVLDTTGLLPIECLPVFVSAKRPEAWSGWAWLNAADVRAIEPGSSFEQIEQYLVRERAKRCTVVPGILSVQTPADYLAAQKSLLDGTVPGLLRTGREISPGIWLSRNAVVHRNARLTAPVFVGPDTRIGKGALVGPHVVVGEGSIVGASSQIREAAVLPNTYVGEALEIVQSIVQGNKLTNVSVGAQATIVEPFILSVVKKNSSTRPLSRLFGRIVAGILLFVTSPILLLGYAHRLLTDKKRWARHRVICPSPAGEGQSSVITVFESTESSSTRSLQRHFVEAVLPRLPHVVLGHLDLVGLPPRTEQELQTLPPHWRNLGITSRAGAITEALVQFGVAPTREEFQAADAYYSAFSYWRHDLRLVIRYFLSLFLIHRRRASRAG